MLGKSLSQNLLRVRDHHESRRIDLLDNPFGLYRLLDRHDYIEHFPGPSGIFANHRNSCDAAVRLLQQPLCNLFVMIGYDK